MLFLRHRLNDKEKLPAKRCTIRYCFRQAKNPRTGPQWLRAHEFHRRSPQSISLDSTGLGGDASNFGEMGYLDSRGAPNHVFNTFQMTIIYEQQSLEEEIVDERYLKQSRVRPRKQYLVQWEQS